MRWNVAISEKRLCGNIYHNKVLAPFDESGLGYAPACPVPEAPRDTDSYVFLTNMGDKNCRVGFKIEAGEVEYHLTNLLLIPHETKVISLRELRDRQEPDFQGNKIPANATEGRLFYLRADLVPLMGRVVVLPRRK